MKCLLVQAARGFGNSPALMDSKRVLSFADYDRGVARAAGALRRRGIKQGDRVALALPNGIDLVMLLMGLLRLGAVACPVSTRLPPAGVEKCIAKINARILITDNKLLRNLAPAILNPDRMLDGRREDSVEGDLISLEQHATIIFSSGSTGEPKAILHTLGNHYYNALGSNENISFEPGDRWLLSLPLYHVGALGILFRSLLGGGAVVMPSAKDITADLLLRHRATHVSMVSAQLHRLLSGDSGLQPVSGQLKAVLLGGGPIPHRLIRQGLAAHLPVHTSYGLTEMASQVTTTPPHAPAESLMTSGKILRFREIKLGADREIHLRGESRFAGYVDGGELKLPFDESAWFNTGDIGVMDEAGFLTILGRSDTMFVSGGENIYPEEIEMAMCRTGEIEQAVVVAIGHLEYGFRPAAFVKTPRGQGLDPDRVRDRLREFLPGYKIPDRIFGWPETVSSGIKPNRARFAALARRLCGADY
ncbi:MAG TPA: o-succinylbenzoate--CoA ligase [Acidobacteriota bacterium]|nr:o-succinylbenzoate--CoA ligase [Acidobacteriota bacterium]